MNQQVIPARLPHSAALASIANPSRDARRGLIIAALFFVVLLGWATFARLDAAAYAPGRLVVSGQRQSVQHRDGGVVRAIHVTEGQRVGQGDLLISIAAAEVEAQERVLASQAIRSLAQRARLEAEQLGQSRIIQPVEFGVLKPRDKAEADLAMKLQRVELQARVAVLAAQRDALNQRAIQSGDQGRGYGDQARSASEQLRLIREQISMLQPLAEKGFVSATRMRELERMRAALEGQRGLYAAGVAQTRSAAQELGIQVLETEHSFRERTASELREIELRLGELLPKWSAARDQLARTKIRAPATGAVVALAIFTPGGVIAPGQKLMEIVPEKQPLHIQLQISPDDADDLTVGHKLLVKFSSLHERSLPNLSGTLTQLSADSFTDERTGQNYFTAEAEIPLSQVRLIQSVRGRDFALRPGMPVQVLIPLRERTALDYILEPLIGSFWTSFREH